MSASSDAGDSRSALRRPPTPLLLALALVVVEALTLMALGVAEVVTLSSARLTMGATTALFFLLYAAGLLLCAAMLYRLVSWARAPLVLAQLIQLGVAWSFREDPGTWVAGGLAVGAVAVLVGVFHPASIAAVEKHELDH